LYTRPRTYPVKSDEFPLGLVQTLRAYHVGHGDDSLVQACFENDPVSVENELQVYDSVMSCIKNQLAQYPTTIQVCVCRNPAMCRSRRLVDVIARCRRMQCCWQTRR
jgi:hypothetical protein